MEGSKLTRPLRSRFDRIQPKPERKAEAVALETLWPAVVERIHESEGGEMLAALLADPALARADLGYQPTVGLEEGLAAEYRWLTGIL